MPTKLLIEVRGGNIVSVTCSREIDVVIIDYDNLADGDSDISELAVQKNPPETRIRRFYDLFSDKDRLTQEIRERLKELKF